MESDRSSPAANRCQSTSPFLFVRYMVMEVMSGGELFDRIVEKEMYTEREARDAVRQIAGALCYLHDKVRFRAR